MGGEDIKGMECPLYNNLGHSNHGHRYCIHRRFRGGTGKTVNDKGTRDALTTAAQKRHIDEFFLSGDISQQNTKRGERKQGAFKGRDKIVHGQRFEALGSFDDEAAHALFGRTGGTVNGAIRFSSAQRNGCWGKTQVALTGYDTSGGSGRVVRMDWERNRPRR